MNMILAGLLCSSCCFSVVGVIMLAIAGVLGQSISDDKAAWTPTVCSVAWSVAPMGSDSSDCGFTVETGLTGDRLWRLDFTTPNNSYAEDMVAWAKNEDCWNVTAGDAAACDEPEFLNCTGECFLSEDGAMVSDERRAGEGKGTGMVLLIVFGGGSLGLVPNILVLALLHFACCDHDTKLTMPGRKTFQCGTVCCFITAVVLIALGLSTFGSSQDGLWEKTTCSAVIVRRGTSICSPEVQTALTLDRNYSLSGYMQDWHEDNGCDAGLPSKAWVVGEGNPACDDGLLLDCSGDCWVSPELAEVADSGGGAFFTFAGAVVLVFCGLLAAALSAECLFAALAQRWWPRSAAPADSDKRVHAEVLGAMTDPMAGSADPQGLAMRKLQDKLGKLEILLRRGVAVVGYVLTSLACLGGLLGVFVTVALYMVSERYSLDGNICWAGAVLILIFLLLLLLGWVGLLLIQRKARGLLQEVGEQCARSGDDPQKVVVGGAIHLLKKNPSCIKKMTELGVNADKLQEVLSLPPEQIPEALVALVGIVVIVQIAVGLIQDQLRSIWEPYIAQFGLCVVGMPGVITTSLLTFAIFAVEYEADISSSIVSALTLVLYIFLYLEWVKFFTIGQCVLGAYLMIFAIVKWAMNGGTVVSVLCWIGGILFFVVFLILCYLWFRIILPILEIQLEIALEYAAIEVYSACGCERDPQVLKDLQSEEQRRMRGCPQFLGDLLKNLLVLALYVSC